MTLNREKIYHVSKLMELMSKGKLHRDVRKSRQVGRTFKLVNPKHNNRASVRNDSLSLNLLVCWAEICKQCVCLFLIRQKSLRNRFSL